MTAYWLARTNVLDAEKFKEYAARAPGAIAKHGGKSLALHTPFEVMEGAPGFGHFIVIEFPSYAQALACHRSTEYQEAAAMRGEGAAEIEIVIVAGNDEKPS